MAPPGASPAPGVAAACDPAATVAAKRMVPNGSSAAPRLRAVVSVGAASATCSVQPPAPAISESKYSMWSKPIQVPCFGPKMTALA